MAAAASYGVSDFLGGLASRRAAALRVVLVSYALALAMIGVIAVAVDGTISLPAILWGSLCGLSQGLGVWLFYAALGAGPISVVAPPTAVLAAGVPFVVGLAIGERPGPVAVVGAVMAMVAVVLISREATDEDVRPHLFTRAVARMTMGAGLAFGLNFVLIDRAPADAGLWPVFFVLLSATVMVAVVAAFTGDLHVPKGFALKLTLAAAVIDVGANVAMLLALRTAMLSTASVLMSLYPAVTVVLAIVVLRERVTGWQRVGMVLALIAVAMISVH